MREMRLTWSRRLAVLRSATVPRRTASISAVTLLAALISSTACGSGPLPKKPPRKPAPKPTAAAAAGTGLMRLGDTFQPGSSYRAYDYLVVGFSDVLDASKKKPRVLVYKGAVDVTQSPNRDPGLSVSGVSYAEAAAHGLLLKDAAGHELKAGASSWIGDVGSRDFQKRWVRNVLPFIRARHGEGVFIDNVLCSVTGLAGGAVAAKYPTDAAWANAQASFIAYVGKALRAKGIYVAVNVYCGGPDDGSANDRWLRRIAPFIDGAMIENFEQNPNDHSQLFYDSPSTSWLGNWLGRLNAIRTLQRTHRDAFALTYGPTSDTRAMTYGRASFLLVWNGKGGAFFFDAGDGSNPENPAWMTGIGRPQSPMQKVGAVYVRSYSRGYVVVNPSLDTAHVDLPAGLKSADGAAAGGSAELAPVTAAIYTR